MPQREALFFSKPYQVEIRAEPPATPQSGEALVQTAVSAISAGTELLFYRGQIPPDMSVDSSIDGLQNKVSYPLKYGYALVGHVIAVGADVDPRWLGEKVFLFHPHESHFVTRVSNLKLVPEGLPAETAVFLPFMETAVSFLMDGQPMIGEKVTVFGQGIVGLLTTALLAQYPLAQLVTLDRFSLRRRWSRELGANQTFDVHSSDLPDKLAGFFLDDPLYSGADLIYELTGNPQALNQAIALTGYAGRILIGSWYGQKLAPLALGGRFHRNHMRLISSQVSSIAPQWRGRFAHDRRLQYAWSLLALHRPEKLISHRFHLSEADQAYNLLDERPEETLQIIFTYQKEGS